MEEDVVDDRWSGLLGGMSAVGGDEEGRSSGGRGGAQHARKCTSECRMAVAMYSDAGVGPDGRPVEVSLKQQWVGVV